MLVSRICPWQQFPDDSRHHLTVSLTCQLFGWAVSITLLHVLCIHSSCGSDDSWMMRRSSALLLSGRYRSMIVISSRRWRQGLLSVVWCICSRIHDAVWPISARWRSSALLWSSWPEPSVLASRIAALMVRIPRKGFFVFLAFHGLWGPDLFFWKIPYGIVF